MRVTNSMLTSNYLNNLSSSLYKLDKLQSQLATNRKYAHISDDPVSVIYSQQARYKLNRLTHYKKNVETAQEWLTQTEAGIMDINNVLKSAYEAAVDAATDVETNDDMKNAAEFIGQLRDQILQSLNSTFGDKFVFGGYNTTGNNSGTSNVPPFTVVGGELHYNGADITALDPYDPADTLANDVIVFDVGVGSSIEVTLNGARLAIYDPNSTDNDNNVYDLLNDLYNTMRTPGCTADDISKFIPKIQMAQSHVLALAAEIGGRSNRLDILNSRYEQDEINYTQMKSNAEDADEAEVIMRYKMAESVYKAALATGSFIIQPSLMDFLN